jgi:bifunctional non-homologous end joining protein LigD
MALAEYRRKRNFRKTPEPLPSRVVTRKTGLSYVVQKHDATRLHYDFRLELDGVLLSWAVTKGPSLSPTDKRLAVRTEDHPLSYGAFEGTIPKGEYGGGTVMLWDQGKWEPREDPHAALAKGHLSFVLHGERLKGVWDLIRMRAQGKRENWLLIKAKDKYARQNTASGDFLDKLSFSVMTGRSMDKIAEGEIAKPKQRSSKTRTGMERLLLQYPEVQLATLVDRAPDGAEWLHEIKFDGYRLLGFLSGGTVCLRTRNGKDWPEKFPTIVASVERLKVRNAVLDIEAVVLNKEGKSGFQALQAALSEGGKPEAIVAYVFDLLHFNGENLTNLPLSRRKEALKGLLANLPESGGLRYSDHVVGKGPDLFSKVCAMGLEGVVSKKSDSRYVAGRQKLWLKSKCTLRREFIILAYSRASKGDRPLGALYLGLRKDGKMRYAGKVGTGFSIRESQNLMKRFATLAVKQPGLSKEEMGVQNAEWKSIGWIQPVLLGEVAFTEWTRDGRVRHPSFQGLREDKDASEAQKETPATRAPRAKPAIPTFRNRLD